MCYQLWQCMLAQTPISYNNLFSIQHVICHLQHWSHETKVCDLLFGLFSGASFKVSNFKRTQFLASSVNNNMQSHAPQRNEPVGSGEPLIFSSSTTVRTSADSFDKTILSSIRYNNGCDNSWQGSAPVLQEEASMRVSTYCPLASTYTTQSHQMWFFFFSP